MKFTQKGEVILEVSLLKKLEDEDKWEGSSEESDEEDLFLKIAVKDTGCGIKEAD